MITERKKRIWLAVAMGHLILVACGAASLRFSALGKPGRLLEYYSTLSGAETGYGFFAPGVGGRFRARFDLCDRRGRLIPVDFDTPTSHEAAIRVGNIIDEFMDEDETEDDSVHRSLVASLAGKMLGRHPESERVRVRLERFEPVSMKDFRRGIRPAWQGVYEATFVYHRQPLHAEVRP